MSARCTRLKAAGQEHGIDAQPSEHVNVARNAWKVPLDIYNLTSDISILNIHYVQPKKVHKIYLVQKHPIINCCFGTNNADKVELLLAFLEGYSFNNISLFRSCFAFLWLRCCVVQRKRLHSDLSATFSIAKTKHRMF